MDYPQNSHRSKEAEKQASPERKKVEKVVTGTVKTKKKSEIGKWAHLLVHEGVPKIKTYVLRDIFAPAFKKAMMGTLEIILNGGSSGNYNSDYSPGPKVQYRKYSEEPAYGKLASPGTVQAKNIFEYEDIEFPDRGSAECVLSKMKDIFAEYHSVTIAEMYEAAGLSHPYTFTKYGWMSLRGVEVIRRGDSYFIKLPPATLIAY